MNAVPSETAGTPANGRKDGAKERASKAAGNAKPSSSPRAKQGEKKTTGGKSPA